MGYEYDYVFDWMVKKPNPQMSIANKEDHKEPDGGVGLSDGQIPSMGQNKEANAGAASTGNNLAT